MQANLDSDLLAKELDERFRGRAYSPPMLPATAIEALELSRQRDVDFKRLRTLFDREPFLTARVLQVARSPVFHGTSTVGSLDEAMSRLGSRMLCEVLVMETMRSKLFRAEAYAPIMTRVTTHSTMVGYLTRLVSERARIPVGGTFLLGLLHDAGLAAGIALFAERPPALRPPVDSLLPALVSAHELGSKVVATAWDLPPEITDVVGRHHGHLSPEAPPALHALRVAEHLAALVGSGAFESCDDIAPSMGALDLGAEDVDSMAQAAERLTAELGLKGGAMQAKSEAKRLGT